MHTLPRLFFGLSFALVVFMATSEPMQAQQQALNSEDNLKAEDFTKILKDEWSYLKETTDEFLGVTAKKTEFETSKEYNDRVARLKAAYINKIGAHIKDKKFDKRIFTVLFKASLVSYNADLQQYQIAGAGSIEAPYDIPTLRCIVPPNPFVALADSVNRGFRSSALRIRLPSDYRWKVGRDDARAAKGDENNVYFRVRFVIDMQQEDMVKQAKLRMIPKEIAMVNTATQKIYWTEQVK
jgi:hypothetical protein